MLGCELVLPGELSHDSGERTPHLWERDRAVVSAQNADSTKRFVKPVRIVELKMGE